MMRQTDPLPLHAVRVTGGFWASRQRLMTDVTIP